MTSYPPTPASPAGSAYPEASQAQTALILGLVGLIGGIITVGLLFLVSPFALVVGNREKKAIDAGRRDPAGRSNAHIGWVTGLIGTILLALGVIGWIIFFVSIGALVASGS